MLLTLVDLLIVALATNQVIEIWRHSELFRERRFQIQIMKEGFESQSSLSWLDRPIYWWCRLMLCNWCLSVWVALLVAIAYLSAIAGGEIAARIIRAVLLTFAVSRAANLINDVLYQYCRTPKYDQLPEQPAAASFDIAAEHEAMRAETNAANAETNAPDRGTSGLFPETPAVSDEMTIKYDDETKKSGTITVPNSVNIYTNQPYDKNSTKPGPGRDGHG